MKDPNGLLDFVRAPTVIYDNESSLAWCSRCSDLIEENDISDYTSCRCSTWELFGDKWVFAGYYLNCSCGSESFSKESGVYSIEARVVSKYLCCKCYAKVFIYEDR